MQYIRGGEVWGIKYDQWDGAWLPSFIRRVERVGPDGGLVRGKWYGPTAWPVFDSESAATAWAAANPPSMPDRTASAGQFLTQPNSASDRPLAMPLVVCFDLSPGHLVYELHESLTDGIGLELHVWDGWAWLVTDEGEWLGCAEDGQG